MPSIVRRSAALASVLVALPLLMGALCQFSRPNPYLNLCQNGVLEPDNGEECDDGIEGNSDQGACTLDCKIAVCGDSLLYEGVEACDEGDANNELGPCSADCEFLTCGDGILQDDEECDEGADNRPTGTEYGGCADCTWLPRCGDGITQTPWEACDDANDDDSDMCTSECTIPTCGDGIVQESNGEECDDGNSKDEDSCLSTCIAATCGDGIVWKGEEKCDDANTSNTDACLNTCTLSYCGDGFLYEGGGEWCDDANEISTDGCTNTCDIDRMIFVTKDLWAGFQISTVGTADTRCWTRAMKAGHPRPMAFRAWLSNGVDSPLDHHHSDGPYKLSTGQVVAINWEDLTDGQLEHAIDRSADGTLIEGPVWTATAPDGSPYATGHCNNWTASSKDSDEPAIYGWSDLADSGWTNYTDGFALCDFGGHLYCIEAY